jgi:hypothetical protein
MSAHPENLGLVDGSLSDFLDTLNLSDQELRFMKEQCLDPNVAEEVKKIWHNLECWGEDCRDNAAFMVRDLIARIRTPQ